jgi:nucleotide-binding universal stress UspA family protein
MHTKVNSSDAAAGTNAPTVIIVGVDGSSSNRPAVAWAHHEAHEMGARLELVAATHEYSPPTPRFSIDYTEELFTDDIRKTLERTRDELGASKDQSAIIVGSGGARSVLLRAAEHADVLVLGKRGLSAAKRLFVGSNSIAIAGRSPIPVVVVPDQWVPAPSAAGPVLVGLDGSAADDAVLGYAFERCGRLAAPLIIVHAWQVPTIYTWSPEDIRRWSDQARTDVDTALARWAERRPDIKVTTRVLDSKAATAILDTAAEAEAQIVVLGRHTGPHHVGGFHLGSTARAVLHYAESPVAVIPSEPHHPAVENHPTTQVRTPPPTPSAAP